MVFVSSTHAAEAGQFSSFMPVMQQSFRLSLRIFTGVLLLAGFGASTAGHAADARTQSAANSRIESSKNHANGEIANWLARIQAAAQKTNYSGNFISQQGEKIQSSRITHLADRSGEHEKLEILDGQVREYIRHNDEVKCYVPDNRLIIAERRQQGDRFPAMLTAPPGDIEQHYKRSAIGTERVAGRMCNVSLLEPRDKLRYGYRLWTDQASGLLLKVQTLNERGEVIDQTGFTEVSIGAAMDPSRIRPSMATKGWRTEILESRPADLSAAGWSIKSSVAGFQKVREIKRIFNDRREVAQIVFSDGLATISVFIESAGTFGASESNVNKGPLNVLSKRFGDHWLTVVGEVPFASIRQMANAIEHKTPVSK